MPVGGELCSGRVKARAGPARLRRTAPRAYIRTSYFGAGRAGFLVCLCDCDGRYPFPDELLALERDLVEQL
jgi:hypothetical protein